MSRLIDRNDPDTWDDEDRAYLAERSETVPAEHRHLLRNDVGVAQKVNVVEGVNPSLAKLTKFMNDRFPDRAGQDPVLAAIEELGGSVDETPAQEAPPYNKWKTDELKAEAEGRVPEAEVTPTGRDGATTKADYVRALESWDRQYDTE